MPGDDPDREADSLASTPENLLEQLRDLDHDTLLEQARSYVTDGVVGDPLHAPDPVNVPMVRHYCTAVGDHDPVYLDEAVANGTRHKGLVAPPAMLGVWTMDTPRHPGGPRDQVLRRLDAAGYTSVVATDYSHEYLEPVRPGDRLHERRSIEDLVGPKRTGLGEGVFVTSRYDYLTEDGTLVGIGRMRLLKFRPPDRPAGAGRGAGRPRGRPRPVINRDNRFFWDGVAAGELRIQRCTGCEQLRHPPGPMCPHCGSTGWDWVVASGRGTIVSHAVHHHPPLPGIELPHAVVLVELEEGVRYLSEATGMSHRDVAVGLDVELSFIDVPGDDGEPMVVPAFAPTPGALPEDPDAPASVEDVRVGVELPGIDVAITPTFVVTSALATRDFEEVHHDPAIARERGSEDLFPNILTSNGLALRLVTDWLGPEARIERASVRLGLPAYVGETLRMRGEVVAVAPRPDRDDGEIEVAVRGRISTGDHLTGTVVASLPMEG